MRELLNYIIFFLEFRKNKENQDFFNCEKWQFGHYYFKNFPKNVKIDTDINNAIYTCIGMICNTKNISIEELEFLINHLETKRNNGNIEEIPFTINYKSITDSVLILFYLLKKCQRDLAQQN